jgi:hypothetical protein
MVGCLVVGSSEAPEGVHAEALIASGPLPVAFITCIQRSLGL